MCAYGFSTWNPTNVVHDCRPQKVDEDYMYVSKLGLKSMFIEILR